MVNAGTSDCHSPASSRNSLVSGLRSGRTWPNTFVVISGTCAAFVKGRSAALIVADSGAGSTVIVKVPYTSSWLGAIALNRTKCVPMSV